MNKLVSRSWIVVLLCAVALSGCSSVITARRDNQIQQDVLKLNSQRLCCDNFAQLTFTPLHLGSQLINVDYNAPVFNFPTGQSYAVPLALPSEVREYSLTLNALLSRELISAHSLFYPSAVYLDNQYAVLAVANQLNLVATGSAEQAGLRLTLTRADIPANTHYLVLFTDATQFGQNPRFGSGPSTTPDRESNAADNLADKFVARAPTGLLQLTLVSSD